MRDTFTRNTILINGFAATKAYQICEMSVIGPAFELFSEFVVFSRRRPQLMQRKYM